MVTLVCGSDLTAGTAGPEWGILSAMGVIAPQGGRGHVVTQGPGQVGVAAVMGSRVRAAVRKVQAVQTRGVGQLVTLCLDGKRGSLFNSHLICKRREVPGQVSESPA